MTAGGGCAWVKRAPMSRRPRLDLPGSRHHLMNRGVSHRVMVEGDADATRFLDFLVEYFGRYGVRIITVVVLQTHFHIFAESEGGGLALAMQCLESRYAKAFNCRLDRDGGLVRARFLSKVVATESYLRALVPYIDQNPVVAGLVERAVDYPYGSRRFYARLAGPDWLSRSVIESRVMAATGASTYDPAQYDRVFGAPRSAARARWFEAVVDSRAPDVPLLDELVRATPAHIRDWMAHCARNADGDLNALRVVDPESILLAVESFGTGVVDRVVHRPRRSSPLRAIILPALLRQFAAQTWAEIARTLGTTIAVARARVAAHLDLFHRDPAYAELVSLIARDAIERCHG